VKSLSPFVSSSAGLAWGRLVAWLRAAPSDAILELASRVGYAARGVVYLGVGAIALMAALDWTVRAAGPAEALRRWAEGPAGVLLIGLVAAGLACFAMWRGLQAVFNAEHHGRRLKDWLARGGEALSGVTHAALAWSMFELLDGIEDLGEEQEADVAAGQVLALPGGDLWLIAGGLVVLGLGLGNAVQAIRTDFARRLACDANVCRWAVPLARAGYLGRAIALAPLGFFMTEAGLDARAAAARSFGSALQTLEAQPSGSLVLGLTALGLAAFGLFGLVEARYRRIQVPEELAPG
jgi:hypothetical protein